VIPGFPGFFARRKIDRIVRSGTDSLYIYHCNDCNYYEIWDIANKDKLFVTKVDYSPQKEPREHVEKEPLKISNSAKEVTLGVVISSACSLLAFYMLVNLSITGSMDFKIFGITSWAPFTHIVIFLLAAGFMLLVTGFSYAMLVLIDKKIHLQEKTLMFHQLLYGNQMYYLELNAKQEKTHFGASFKRAIFGTVLMLGISILVLENFLILPDLKPMFEIATYITLVVEAACLPIILVFFYISPLLNKEVNLYYFDKKDRIVKNVGSWLDEALHFFAIVDIILTMVIVLDSDLEGDWFGLIACFVALVFSFFLVFTIIFNKFFHARLKEKYIQHLKGKYNLPIRKASMYQQTYYCRKCGSPADAVQHDSCQVCNTRIFKCMICNEVVNVTNVVGKARKPLEAETEEPHITAAINKMENKMAGSLGKEYPSVQCPNCNELAHLDEFISWIKLRGTCPNCKVKVNFFDLF